MAWITVSRPVITPEVTALAATGDGKRVVSARGEGNGSQIEIWQGETGEQTGAFHVALEIVRDLSISADGGRIVTSGSPGGIHLWDVASRSRIETPSPSPFAVQIGTGDDSAMLLRHSDGSVSIRNTDGNRRVVQWQDVPPGRLLAATPEPVKILIQHDDSILRLWDPAGKKDIWTVQRTSEAILARVCPGRNYIALADGELSLWSLDSGKPLWQCRPGRLRLATRITALNLLPGGSHLLSAALDLTLRLWRAEDGRQLAAIPIDAIVHQLLVRGNRVFAGSASGALYFLELQGVGPAGAAR
jgi:WD40 repeat protein